MEPDTCPPWWPNILWWLGHPPPPPPPDRADTWRIFNESFAAIAVHQLATQFKDGAVREAVQKAVAPIAGRGFKQLAEH